MQPLVDSSLVPLPFLVFKDGTLCNCNEGARSLLSLQDGDDDGEYSFDTLFPPSLPGSPNANALSKTKHLQTLKARVSVNGAVLKCKAAVYETPKGQSPAIRSILIVDVAGSGSSLHDTGRTDDDDFEMVSDSNDASGDHVRPLRSRSSSSGGQSASPSRPHLSHAIKRHSGDIRKIWTSTVERRKAEKGEKTRGSGTSSAAGNASASHADAPGVSRASPSAPSASGQPNMFPVPSSSRMTGSVSASSASPSTSALHRKRPSEPNIVLPSNLWAGSAADGTSSAVPASSKPSTSALPSQPQLPTRNSNSGESSSASTRSKASTTFFANAAAASVAETADFSLAQSALAAHPRTGVIISKADMSSGFINSRTRELLMGVKSPTDEYSTNPFDDMWYSQDCARERQPAEESNFTSSGLSREDVQAQRAARVQAKQDRQRKRDVRSQAADGAEHDEGLEEEESSDDQGTAIDEDKSPVWEDEIIFEDGKVRIDLPDRGENLQTSISDILRWSLRRRRVRQHHRAMRDEVASVRSGRSGSVVSPPASIAASSSSTNGAHGMTSASGPRASLPMTAREAEQIMQTLKEEEKPWLARKPYKVYDAAFSQRVEDPFEQLFDQAVRKGDHPAADQSVIVGIETEVGPPETCLFPESECFIHASESGGKVTRTRVRRRVVQARAAPLKDMNGEHIGGVVWLRDITGEVGAPAPNPTITPDGKLETGKQVQPPGSVLPAGPSVASMSPGFQGPAGLDGLTFWQHVINNMAQ